MLVLCMPTLGMLILDYVSLDIFYFDDDFDRELLFVCYLYYV
jgi:hypothetical protein